MKLQNKLPQCCGQDMRINLDTTLYVELLCEKCHDIIYMKKKDMPKPQLIDD